MTNPYKPMSGRPGRLNCETPEAQSASGKRGGLKKLDANQIEALWDLTQAHVRATFYWKAPEAYLVEQFRIVEAPEVAK